MDISIFGIGSVAAITVLCYLVGSGVSAAPTCPEKAELN